MKSNTPPAILSRAIREFLDELAELISEEILQENGGIQDERSRGCFAARYVAGTT